MFGPVIVTVKLMTGTMEGLRKRGKEKKKQKELSCFVSVLVKGGKTWQMKQRRYKKKNPTLTMGQSELNNRERGMSIEEFGNPKEAIGKQNAEKGRSFRDLDRESFSGKSPNHKTSISVGGVGDGGVGINTGEKI